MGDTSGLPDSVVADFRASGLSHLVAVSGENVAFVLVLVGPVMRRVPHGARLATGVAVLVVFGSMTRWEPSVLRACAMAGCSMLALTLGRPTVGLRALTLSITALLLGDPFLVHSVGFQLSCAASVGIAVLGPPITAWVPGPRWVRESIGVTVGAQVAVAPVLVAVFGGIPLITVAANLGAGPLVGPLTVSGLAGGVLGGVVRTPVVAVPAACPALVLASGVLLIARVAARVPLQVGGWSLGGGLAAGALVFACWRIGRATWVRARTVSAESRVAFPPR